MWSNSLITHLNAGKIDINMREREREREKLTNKNKENKLKIKEHGYVRYVWDITQIFKDICI